MTRSQIDHLATSGFIVISLLCALNFVAAEEVQFRFRTRPHLISDKSEYAACAVFDVNGDGKNDIVCGGQWYEGPDWRPHLLREVERIGNRYDDYSSLPIDLNGDGRLDLVSVNYRSKSLYWVEHPGDSIKGNPETPWKKHPIESPGPSETGRLHDVDGDGQLDVLPNGTSYAAWFRFTTENGKPIWTRHELPPELIGHGIGFGDVNGDGRGDIVCPKGWAEAPADRRKDRWVFHADFRLAPDCSIPILVHDVDGDGDRDLIYARAHHHGLYWVEQLREKEKSSTWQIHVIDTSWSQGHALLLGDLDGDGQPDLVTGSRCLGHDGRDPGEYDPRRLFAYRFDPKTRAWPRTEISNHYFGDVGLGLDPKLDDLDGDGDLDIITADRNGLRWYENERLGMKDSSPMVGRIPTFPSAYDHANLLEFNVATDVKQKVASPEEFGKRREHILLAMQAVMGPLPTSERRVPLDIKVVAEEETSKYLRRKITYAAEPGDRVPAWLLIPKGLKKPAPAMLCLHPTHVLGKDQLVGLGGLKTRHYAHELAERGYICLAPDYPSFGEYQDFDFKHAERNYASGSMKAIWNNLRAVDLLETMPEVDPERIGAIGHSLGGHNALFTAAFDYRIKATVTSCGFCAFEDYYGGKLAGWTSDRYMPRIRDVYQNDPKRMPFDFSEVLGAIAPRGVFVSAPRNDNNFAFVGVEKSIKSASAVYDLWKKPEQLRLHASDGAHDFADPERKAAYEWLDERLLK